MKNPGQRTRSYVPGRNAGTICSTPLLADTQPTAGNMCLEWCLCLSSFSSDTDLCQDPSGELGCREAQTVILSY